MSSSSRIRATSSGLRATPRPVYSVSNRTLATATNQSSYRSYNRPVSIDVDPSSTQKTTSSSASFLPLTTVYVPPPACQSALLRVYPKVKVNETVDLSRAEVNGYADPECNPAKNNVYTFSPGLYCPSGYIASVLTTYFAPAGNIELPETEVACCRSGDNFNWNMCNRAFTTPVSVKYVAFTVASEMKIDINGETIYPTIGVGSEARTTVTPDPTMLVRIPATVLRYRETDIPADFVPTQGAQIPLKEADYFEKVFQMVPASDNASHDLKIAFISVMALFFGLGIFIFLWTMFRRRQSRRKKRPDSEHQWFLGAGVYSASVIGIFTGIFAVMYASRKKWQEETIQVFESPNAVRLCVQVMAFIMRTCATVLAWVVVAGIGWLSLARGMGRDELLKTLDMTATGGTYRTGLLAFWQHLKSLSILQALVLFFGLCMAFGSDLVGVSMVASTGIGQTAAGTLQNRTDVPFVVADRTYERKEPLPVVDPEPLHTTSAQRYPFLIRQNNTLGFLPISAENGLLQSYLGVARFGEFSSSCRPVKFTGNINIDLQWPQAVIVGNISDTPFERMKGRVQRQLLFSTRSLPGMWYENSSWKEEDVYGYTPVLSNFFEPTFSQGRSTIIGFSIENLNTGNKLYGLRYMFLLELSVARAENFKWPSSEMAHAVADVKDQDSGVLPSFWTSNRSTDPDITFARLPDDVAWKTRICEVQFPTDVGIISAPSIDHTPTPFTDLCTSSPAQCPNITYYPAQFSTDTWTNDEISQRVRAEGVHDLDFPFYTSGEFSTADPISCPPDPSDHSWEMRATGPVCDTYPEGAYAFQGVVFCHTCGAQKRASTLLSTLMIEAAQRNDDEMFSEAFETVMLHIMAGRYYLHLPQMNGVGPAMWTYVRPATLIMEPFWIYLGVGFTWLLIFLALGVQAQVRSVLGIDRSGSLLKSAAVIQGGPLHPLLERAQIVAQGDREDDGNELDEDKKRALRLGVTPSGRYVVGYSDEIDKPDRRSVISHRYKSVTTSESPA